MSYIGYDMLSNVMPCNVMSCVVLGLSRTFFKILPLYLFVYIVS